MYSKILFESGIFTIVQNLNTQLFEIWAMGEKFTVFNFRSLENAKHHLRYEM